MSIAPLQDGRWMFVAGRAGHQVLCIGIVRRDGSVILKSAEMKTPIKADPEMSIGWDSWKSAKSGSRIWVVSRQHPQTSLLSFSTKGEFIGESIVHHPAMLLGAKGPYLYLMEKIGRDWFAVRRNERSLAIQVRWKMPNMKWDSTSGIIWAR